MGYDLTNPQTLSLNTNNPLFAASVWSQRERLTMEFKTKTPNGLLFVAGDYQVYIATLATIEWELKFWTILNTSTNLLTIY